MALIRSYQWLALEPSGDDARESGIVRTEEREVLLALSAGPARMVDLFRRLRWSDSRQFQELLSRAVGRGWLTVHDDNPLTASTVPVPEKPSQPTALNPAQALEQLLARYDANPESPSVAPAVPEPSQALPPAEEESKEPAPSLPKPGPASEDDWMSALGVTTAPPYAERAPFAPLEEEGAPVSPEHAELLQSLAHAPARPAVRVPAYGLGDSSSPLPEDPGFVRLKDVGGVRGPGDSPSSGGASAPTANPVAPSKAPATSPSVRSRRQNNGRDQFLAATRRNAAARETAKIQADRFKQEQLERKQREEEAVAERRRAEQAIRRPSLREQAERARKIRDGFSDS